MALLCALVKPPPQVEHLVYWFTKDWYLERLVAGEITVFYQTDAEILFPARVIPTLRNLRGDDWKVLIDQVTIQPESAPDVLAFGLMMIRLGPCMSCHSDSFRAMRGCTQCAFLTIMRFKGSDDDLIRLWQIARIDIDGYLATGCIPRVD
jgi:hypothetical protein